MIDTKEIIAALEDLHASGKTYERIAKESGIAQSYIYNLIHGKRDIDGLTIKKINQLFPQAILILEGDKISIQANNNQGNVVGVNHGSVNNTIVSDIMEKVLNSEDFTAEEKIKVLKAMRK